MEDHEAREYNWYMLGCRQFHWAPLSAEEFWPHFKRYRRLSRAIQKYEQRSARRRRAGGLFAVTGRFMDRLVRTLMHERERLDYLASAVAAGQREEGGDTGGAGAALDPPPQNRTDRAAKLLPHLDPEPALRDP